MCAHTFTHIPQTLTKHWWAFPLWTFELKRIQIHTLMRVHTIHILQTENSCTSSESALNKWARTWKELKWLFCYSAYCTTAVQLTSLIVDSNLIFGCKNQSSEWICHHFGSGVNEKIERHILTGILLIFFYFTQNSYRISFWSHSGWPAAWQNWLIGEFLHIFLCYFFFNMQAINCMIIFRYCKAKCHLQQRYHVIANKVHFHLITMSHVVDCEFQNYTLNHFQYTCMREIWNFPEDFRGHVASLVIEIRLKNSFCRRFSIIMQYWPIF